MQLCYLQQYLVQDNGLQPGEVELYGPGCSVRLDADGRVWLQGTILVNGVSLESMVASAVEQALAQQEEV